MDACEEPLFANAANLERSEQVPCAGSAAPACGSGFSIFGDSISTLQGYIPKGWRVHYEGEVSVSGVAHVHETWWGRVVDHFQGHLVANASFSGSVVEGFGFPAGNSDERVRALVGATGEIPDVVMVYMGINDYGWGGGRNQVMGHSASASARPQDLEGPHVVDAVVGQDALDRFARAYRSMLKRIKTLAPNAQIWCLTLAPGTSPDSERPCYKYQIRGIELDAYNDAIRAAALEMGAHVADVRSYGVAYDAVDGCHPSSLGMRQIADMVIAQMEGRGAGDVPPSVSGAPRARRTCARGYCAGCVNDESMPSRWTIVCAGRE